MKITSIIKYFGISIIASASFYASYYVGLLFDDYTILMVICGGIINIFLLFSKDFSVWAEKSIIFTSFVLLMAVVFQSIDMHLLMADLFAVNSTEIKWGTKQLVANCMWFGQGILTLLFSLALTFIAAYRESKNFVE